MSEREPVDAEFELVQPRRIRWGVAIWAMFAAAGGGYYIFEQTGDGALGFVAFTLVFQWPLMAWFADLGERVTPEEAEWLAKRLVRSSRGKAAEAPSNPECVAFVEDKKARGPLRR
ncbi:MAG: hypothetical protein MH112_13325 [Phenylobacterium sp.]|uniref:hypothetical protein n=1 Tax=Phenylobacterium sp. TaxID=1871053 RepID=UPI0025D3A1EB|nr:hypothetical protein [Phenylobacterium sp.]MCG9917324.1 hypothetical protein [Phenylobacterium sp.]